MKRSFHVCFWPWTSLSETLNWLLRPLNWMLPSQRITQSQLGERVPGHNINLSLILMKTIWGKILENLNLKLSETFFNLKIPTMYWGTWNSLVAEFHHPSSYLHSFLEGNMLLRRKAAKKLISTLGKVEFARKNWIQRATKEKLRFYKIEQNTTALHHLLQQRWNVGKFEATFYFLFQAQNL